MRFYDDFAVTTTGIVGLKDTFASQFSLTPNPANSVVNVSNVNNTLINSIAIADINKRIVKTENFSGVANAQINISNLAGGIYMITLTSNKRYNYKKKNS